MLNKQSNALFATLISYHSLYKLACHISSKILIQDSKKISTIKNKKAISFKLLY